MGANTLSKKIEGEGRLYRTDLLAPGEGGTTVIESRLVRAKSLAQARNYATRNRCGARLASQDDLIALLSRGVEVESALAAPEAEVEEDAA